eukprot:GCRY01001886.1.p1 GENE.GCRY01001886.1~~GCRY01001886.1.p1  ORF type:complete len:194 (+),score=43.50 GCRY01001886.1:156-737(+)
MVLKVETEEELKKMFNLFDRAPRNGTIDKQEFSYMVLLMGGDASEENIQSIMSRISSDNEVNFAEFVQLMSDPALRAKLHTPGKNGTNWPEYDMGEDEEEYAIEIDAPGMKDSSLQVELVGNIIVVRGERPPSRICGIELTRHSGKFIRMFDMEKPVDRGTLHCQYKRGQVFITIKKQDPNKKKKKPVKLSFC